MGFGAAQMTTTTGAKFIPEIWSKDAELAREANLVLAKKVKRYDSDVKNGGNKVHIPFVSNLVATAVADNTAVTFQAPTETEIQITLNRNYESSFAVQDILSVQSGYDLAKLYAEKIGYALSQKIDTDIAGLYAGLSQVVGDGTTEITEANVARALLYLDNANAPMTDRFLVVRPSTMYSLRQIAAFTEWHNTGKEGIQVGRNGGMVGDVFGVSVEVSTSIVSVTNFAQNLLFQRDAFALAIQKDVTVEEQRRPDFLATGYIASAIWGFVELRDDHGVVIKTKDNIA
jgi:hypothetical protein